MNRQTRRQEGRSRGARPAAGKKGSPPGPGRRRSVSGFRPGRFLLPAGIALVAAAVIALIAFAVIQAGGGTSKASAAAAAEQDKDPKLPGQWIDPGAVYPATGEHVQGTVPFCQDSTTQLDAQGKVTCYHSNPPTSGPHSDTPVGWGVYTDPVPKEQLVHNMEHGGVIIWYNCTNCDQLVSDIKQVVEGYLKDGKELVMTPYPGMEANTIAFTAWSRLDKFSIGDYTEARLRRFVDAHERRFNPEGF